MMIHKSRLFICCTIFAALATLNYATAFAEDAGASLQAMPAQATSETAEAPTMHIDTDKKAFRFFIDGKEVARIDESGLRVRNDISYEGVVTDMGGAVFDEQAADQGAAQ